MNPLAFAFAFVLATAGAAFAARPIQPDRIETVTLDRQGQAELELRLEDRARLEFDVMIVDDRFGEITVQGVGAKGELRPLGLAGPGTVLLKVQAAQPAAGAIALRIRRAISTDPFEPNDGKAQATAATPPFRSWIELAPGDADWFKLPSGPAGIVGVRLSEGSGVEVVLHDARGKPLAAPAGAAGINTGARYFSAPAGPLFLVITGAPGSSAPQAAELAIVRYAAARDAAGRLVTVGLAKNDADRAQLELAAQAIGAQPLAAADAAQVASAVDGALGHPTGGSVLRRYALPVSLLVLVLALAAVGLYAAYFTSTATGKRSK